MKPLADARFPDLGPGDGHYESWFLKGHHPLEPKAFWLRHTVHQRPGEALTASVWLTLFDGDTVTAGKQTFAGAGVPEGAHVLIGESQLGPGGARGGLRPPTLDADWDLTFAGAGDEQRHLPSAWMYDASVPRTKSGTPYPGVTFGGRLGPFELDGWPGLVSHNWGSQHAERWIWLHAPLDGGRGWLELVLGRIRLGRWTSPWAANGALALDGVRHRLGGLDRARSTLVDERPTGARFVVAGDGVRVEASLSAPPSRFVCWRYADPDGPEHHSAHSSLCDLRAEIRRDGRPPLMLDEPMTASYELGMRETDHGIAIQPFPDP